MTIRKMRSLLYVPGNRQRMVDRALGRGDFARSPVDVAILDLEDGVPPAEKSAARALLSDVLSQPTEVGPARFVRVNRGEEDLQQDLDAVVIRGVDGIVLPKVESADEVLQAVARLTLLERARELSAVPLVPCIESALGLMRSFDIAASTPRVLALMFGGEDYALDLGLPADRAGEAAELVFARSWLVNASVAAHVVAFDGVWPAIKDLDGLRHDTLQARRVGFSGKSAIHPDHTTIINEIFTPTEQEVARARSIVRSFDEAEARREGAVAFNGRMLDKPVVERARRVLQLVDASQ